MGTAPGCRRFIEHGSSAETTLALSAILSREMPRVWHLHASDHCCLPATQRAMSSSRRLPDPRHGFLGASRPECRTCSFHSEG
jgi:hypothetical protein